jgi:hypothetical protein
LTGLALTLPPEALEAIAERAAAIVVARVDANTSPWLTRAEAAKYLRVPLSRLEKDRTVPSHKWGGRRLYLRPELDDFVRSSDNIRP